MRSWLVFALVALCAGAATPRAVASAGADEFAAIDAHALAAPASVAGSVPALAAYLTEPARDEREMARAIFRWITEHIAYDGSAEGYSSDPNLVLSRRRAVCAGYAILFKALAEAARMHAEVILGNSKKFKVSGTEGSDDWVNHGWNAVQIDGQWRLLDCSWGAGHCDESGRFVRRFTPHYFLTPPGVFVDDHFPSDPRWQLLQPPISKDEYLRRAQVRPPFFDHGLRLVSHHSARISAGGSVAVTIGTPPETYLTASVYRNGRPIGEQCAFAQRSAEGYVIQASFPSKGEYVLRVFARRGDATGGDYVWALDYAVQAHPDGESAVGFPEVYRAFLTHNCHLDRPLSRVLPAGKTVEVCISVPDAEDVVVVAGGSWNHLVRQGTRFTGQTQVSAGDFVVYARFPGRSDYEGLLRYTGRQEPLPAETVRQEQPETQSPVESTGPRTADVPDAPDRPSAIPDLGLEGRETCPSTPSPHSRGTLQREAPNMWDDSNSEAQPVPHHDCPVDALRDDSLQWRDERHQPMPPTVWEAVLRRELANTGYSPYSGNPTIPDQDYPLDFPRDDRSRWSLGRCRRMPTTPPDGVFQREPPAWGLFA